MRAIVQMTTGKLDTPKIIDREIPVPGERD